MHLVYIYTYIYVCVCVCVCVFIYIHKNIPNIKYRKTLKLTFSCAENIIQIIIQHNTKPSWHIWNIENRITTHQTDQLIWARRPDLVIVKKKKKRKNRTCRTVGFVAASDNKIEWKESENRDKYLDLARELKKALEHEGNGYTNCNWCT